MCTDAAFFCNQMNLIDTARFSNKSMTNDYVIVSHGRTTFSPHEKNHNFLAYAKRNQKHLIVGL